MLLRRQVPTLALSTQAALSYEERAKELKVSAGSDTRAIPSAVNSSLSSSVNQSHKILEPKNPQYRCSSCTRYNKRAQSIDSSGFIYSNSHKKQLKQLAQVNPSIDEVRDFRVYFSLRLRFLATDSGRLSQCKAKYMKWNYICC